MKFNIGDIVNIYVEKITSKKITCPLCEGKHKIYFDSQARDMICQYCDEEGQIIDTTKKTINRFLDKSKRFIVRGFNSYPSRTGQQITYYLSPIPSDEKLNFLSIDEEDIGLCEDIIQYNKLLATLIKEEKL